jgi:hypothetical protein
MISVSFAYLIGRFISIPASLSDVRSTDFKKKEYILSLNVQQEVYLRVKFAQPLHFAGYKKRNYFPKDPCAIARQPERRMVRKKISLWTFLRLSKEQGGD